MANTERLKVLAAVREARNGVEDLLEKPTITDRGRALLERLEQLLDQAEDELILEELSEEVDAIESTSKEIRKVVVKMKSAEQKIQKLVDAVDKAAKALKILADIAVKAAALA
jgi:hypothetical protein